MSMETKGRGAHIFTIVIRHRVVLVVGGVISAISLSTFLWMWTHGGHFSPAILSILPFLVTMAIGTRCRVYDSGIEIPSVSAAGKMEFLRWEDIGTARWDGSNLTIAGKKEMFQTEEPLQATLPVPASRKSQLVRLMARADAK